MRVLFVFGSLERAGAQLCTLDVCRELLRRSPGRFQFDFCSIGLGPVELKAELASLGGEVHVVPIRSLSFPRRFSALLRDGRYDVVNTEPQLMSGMIAWLAGRQRVPVRIVTIHNSLGDSGKLTSGSRAGRWVQSNAAYAWLMRRLIKRHATRVVAVSRSALDSVFPPSRQPGRHFDVIYNGIRVSSFQAPDGSPDIRDEFGWPEDARILVNVGRLSAQKNHRIILEATRLAHERDRRIRLLLVGSGRLFNEVNGLIDDLGLRDICVLTNGRTDVGRLLLGSDVFLFPSLWEGLPGAALEALAAGLPMVASDIPPIREIAPYFPSSIRMAPPGDASRHAEHIRLALETPADREAAKARFASTPFTLERSVAAYKRLYEVAGSP
jgi:glycosyltransferase involved in cell wall biosynthesis